MWSSPTCHPRSISRAETRQVPVEDGHQLPLGVEHEVAQPDVAPQQDRLALGRQVSPAPLHRFRQRGERVALRGPADVVAPLDERVPEPGPRQHGVETGPSPGHGVHCRHGVDELVVHGALCGRVGVEHVGIEHRCRTGDVAVDAWHQQEGRADPGGVVDRHGRRGGGNAACTDHRLHERLWREVVVGEGRDDRGEPHHDARVSRTEVDEHGLVRQPALCMQ